LEQVSRGAQAHDENRTKYQSVRLRPESHLSSLSHEVLVSDLRPVVPLASPGLSR